MYRDKLHPHQLFFCCNFCLSTHFERSNISSNWKLCRSSLFLSFWLFSIETAVDADSTLFVFACCKCVWGRDANNNSKSNAYIEKKRRINVLRFYAINLGNNAIRLFYITSGDCYMFCGAVYVSFCEAKEQNAARCIEHTQPFTINGCNKCERIFLFSQ